MKFICEYYSEGVMSFNFVTGFLHTEWSRNTEHLTLIICNSPTPPHTYSPIIVSAPTLLFILHVDLIIIIVSCETFYSKYWPTLLPHLLSNVLLGIYLSSAKIVITSLPDRFYHFLTPQQNYKERPHPSELRGPLL